MRDCSGTKSVSGHRGGPVAREGEMGHQSLGMLQQSGPKEGHRGAQMDPTGASGEILLGPMVGELAM